MSSLRFATVGRDATARYSFLSPPVSDSEKTKNDSAEVKGRYAFVTLPRKDHLTVCEVRVAAWQSLKWDPKRVASGTEVSADGLSWIQGGGHSWQGAAADLPFFLLALSNYT